jgi:PKD repeat protein
MHKIIFRNFILFLLLAVVSSCSKDSSHPAPIADFTITGNNAHAPASIYFQNISTHAESYLWEFGNGVSSGQTSPSYTYNSSGSYNVKLTATGPGGVSTTSKVVTIQNEITNCRIVSITVNSMPFTDGSGFTWDSPSGSSPIGPDVYYKIGYGTGTIYYDGIADILNEMTFNDLPIGWTLPIPFEITPLNLYRNIYIYDYDSPSGSQLIGGVNFNPSISVTGYPSTATINDQFITITLGLEWE